MRIGEIARRAGTTPKAARFLTKSVGLLPAPPRAANGYREYMEPLAVLCAAGHCERVSAELRDLLAR